MKNHLTQKNSQIMLYKKRSKQVIENIILIQNYLNYRKKDKIRKS